MRPLAVGGSIIVLVLAGAQTAQASTVEADCSNFATTLAAATAGETIVLSGMCEKPNAKYMLPEVAALTIEGAPGTEDGFDGTGVTGPALQSPGGGTDGLTLRNLTIENYEGDGGGAWIMSGTTSTHPYTFAGDRFAHNSTTAVGGFGNGGGLMMGINEPGTCAFTGGGPAVTLTGSTFTDNVANSQDGGGADIDLECGKGSVSASITDNVFANNRVESASEPLVGGGLFVGDGHFFGPTIPFATTQQGNRFEGNRVVNTGLVGSRVGGGGEFTDGGDVTSVNDAFVGNQISGELDNKHDSEGGGLASLDPGECSSAPGAVSTFTNLVAAGNVIGEPSGGGLGGEGGGVYVGCFPGGHGYHATFVNSTIAGNTAEGAGSAAGLDGETNDTADLQNSIVYGNTGGADLGGFGATDGEHATAVFSDVCAIGSATAAYAGAGNICVPPVLVNASGGDVHETAASPTIDAGSNALIGSQPVDVFGDPRVVAGRTGDAAIVDIGAAEFPAAQQPAGGGSGTRGPGAKTPIPPPLPEGTGKLTRTKAIAGGVSVTVACTGPAGEVCAGTLAVQTVERLRGHRVLAVSAAGRRSLTVTLARASFRALAAGSSVTLKIKLSRTGLALLHHFGRLPVKVLLAQRAAPGTITATGRATVRLPRSRRRG